MKKTVILLLCLFSFGFTFDGLDDGSGLPASRITVDSLGFTKNLSPLDDTVQKALETIDLLETYNNADAQTATGWIKSGSNVYLHTITDNVGIGTSTPSEKLEVNGTGKFITSIDTPAISNLTDDGFIKTSGGDGTLSVDTNTYLTAEADTLATVTARGATTFENIGIGTSAPNSQLEIGGSFASKTTIVSGNTSLDATHHRIIVTDTATITLPTAVGIAGREYNIINGLVGIGTVTISTTGGQTIRGDASLEMYDRGSVVVISDGTNWERGS